MALKLTLELIPKSNWGISLANLLPKRVWDSLRKEVYRIAGHKCVLCNQDSKVLHCHEVWTYDDRRRVQRLAGFMCLCEDCHSIKHWGRTTALMVQGTISRKYWEGLIKHFCKVNKCNRRTFEGHKEESYRMYDSRNRKTYKIDFGAYNPEKVINLWKRKGGIEFTRG